MAQITQAQTYKRTMSGSLGAGMNSVFGGSGKKYFILEHKTESKYHRSGEAQEIIVDQVEIGRDPKCQVRYDEHFETVSRRHAAIVKEGANWKLVPLSKTNPTFLNGKQVQKEWFLQNGDEIQCSVNGPKLGFIIPTGKNSTVGSIGFTRRLSLFRQQAMRPYKRAITALSLALLLVIAGSVGWNYWQYKENQKKQIEFDEIIAEAQSQINSLKLKNDTTSVKYEEIKKRLDSIPAKPVIIAAPTEIQDLLEKCKGDVYYLDVTEVYLTDGTRKSTIEGYGWSGTGFLLNDGRFVTARHCIQGWRFYSGNNSYIAYQIAIPDNNSKIQIEAVIEATSKSGKKLTFNSKDFVLDDSFDRRDIRGYLDDGTAVYWTSARYAVSNKIFSTDWAYVTYDKTKSKGKLSFDPSLSNHLKTGAELHVLGFPMGHGVGESAKSFVNPTYNRFSVGIDGLDDSGCFLHTRGVDHGNSGGPILYRRGNELTVVGIVSRGSNKSIEYAYGVPISAIQK